MPLAGKLRNRAQFYRKVAGPPNEMNEPTVIRQLVHTAFVSMLPLRGNELLAAAQRWAEARFEIWMYYVDGIEREMELDVKNRTLNILDAEDQYDDRRYLRLICQEYTR